MRLATLMLCSSLSACVGHGSRTLTDAESAVLAAEATASVAGPHDADFTYHLTFARLLMDEAKRLANDGLLDDAEDLAARARKAAAKARPAGSPK